MRTEDRFRPGPMAWILAGFCAVSGTILYILSAGQWANVLWGSVYGLGFLGLSLIFSPQPGAGGLTYFVVGTFLWPIATTVLIAHLAEYLLRSQKRRLIIAIFIVSNLFVYPMRLSLGTIVYYLPIYGVFLEYM
jgi:hypothetical protein